MLYNAIVGKVYEIYTLIEVSIMKSNRELVLDLLLQSAKSGDHPNGLSTQYMAQRLNIQRTNLSSVLNALVRDKKLEKVNGRPVLYRLAGDAVSTTWSDDSCFSELLGPRNLLYPAIQLVKAAELYPGSPIPILISGPVGCGKTEFLKLMFRFAQMHNVLSSDSQMIRVDCSEHLLDPKSFRQKLFSPADGLITHLDNHFIVLEQVDRLVPGELKEIARLLQNHEGGLLAAVINEASQEASVQNAAAGFFPAQIRLPSLSEWSLSDRLNLIRRFFTQEAGCVGKKIIVGSELLICLLLYPCKENLRQLHTDIRMGCANAYMRCYEQKTDSLMITASDMPDYVRRGLLSIKERRAEIEELIPQNYNFSFSSQGVHAQRLESTDIKDNLYQYIDSRTSELLQRGIPAADVNDLIVLDINNAFSHYSGDLARRVVNKSQLTKLVDDRLIRLVEAFLSQAEQHFSRLYPAATFYGLCLHLNNVLQHTDSAERSLTSDQLLQIINNHKNEYAFSSQLITSIEKEFRITLRPEESAFVALFLCEDGAEANDSRRPAVLIAMHGRGVASGIAAVVRAISGGEITAYDMDLDKDLQLVYSELKSRILECDCERGILAIYDMGSFKQMFEMIQQECGIVIYAIQVPITLMAIEAARLAPNMDSLTSLRETLANAFQDVAALSESLFHRSASSRVIITCCASGQGGAIITKQYLEAHLDLDGIDVIPLAIADRNLLIQEINRIREKHQILCLIGIYDPQIYGLPFYPVNAVYTTELYALAEQLHLNIKDELERSSTRKVILDHLKTEFTHIDGERMEQLLPPVMKQLRCMTDAMQFDLAIEQEVGLMVHIACSFERLASGTCSPTNRWTDEILHENAVLYQKLLEILDPLEQAFGIKLPKEEFANIIVIIKKLQK